MMPQVTISLKWKQEQDQNLNPSLLHLNSTLFFLWPSPAASGILGTELMNPARQAWNPYHQIAREFPLNPTLLQTPQISGQSLNGAGPKFQSTQG